MTTTGRTLSIGGLALFVAVALISCCGGIPGPDFYGALLFGWLKFLVRVLWNVEFRWSMIGSTVVYAAILVAGSHYFLGWLRREMVEPGGSSVWKWNWTIGGFLIVVLMFVSGMAAIGIAHQTAWIAGSPQPMFRPNRGQDAANRVKCASNMRQIGLALRQYTTDHEGHFPDDLLTLLANQDLTPQVFFCAGSPLRWMNDKTAREKFTAGKQSYFYFGKGLIAPVPGSRIIAVEDLDNHNGKGINVLHADGSVDFVNSPQAEALLEKLGFERVEEPAPR